MIGMVLAAGAGRRLRPDTDGLPKALLPVDGQVTILDIALRNLAAVGLRDIVIVVGYAADVVRDRRAGLEGEHGVRLTLVDNDRAEEWNNAYSLWLAREHFAAGVLLVNGDTVHPVSVEKTLLAAGRGPLATEPPLSRPPPSTPPPSTPAPSAPPRCRPPPSTPPSSSPSMTSSASLTRR